jgi:predicted Fe-Mo cluster-binding NifX family protein
MKVAIPHLDDNVAPCFEAASSFVIAVVEEARVVSRQQARCTAAEGHKRIQLLQVHGVSLLVCNGIESLYEDMLTASGVTVIKSVSAPVDVALQQLLVGQLTVESPSPDELPESSVAAQQEMVAWAREFFEAGGYIVSDVPGSDYALLDLVAEITCPRCGRPVRVAICCGSHTYRPSQEITEFHHGTPTGFNARVYVCPTAPAVVECCRGYGIQHLDPQKPGSTPSACPAGKLPILVGLVADHEKASQLESET